MEQKDNAAVTPARILEELAAIGFAKATDYLCVEDGSLVIRPTRELTDREAAAVAAMERTSSGIKVKLYDKLKALELMGKCLGLFDGDSDGNKPENNLLEAILAATREEVTTDDIPELQ